MEKNKKDNTILAWEKEWDDLLSCLAQYMLVIAGESASDQETEFSLSQFKEEMQKEPLQSKFETSQDAIGQLRRTYKTARRYTFASPSGQRIDSKSQ